MGITENVLLTNIAKELEKLNREQQETNRLLRILAGETPAPRRF
jgi:hypothetical protein